jgi:hypothetical protein
MSDRLIAHLQCQPKIILQPPEKGEQHLRRAILLLARERPEILHHLFEHRAHRGSIPRRGERQSVSVTENDTAKSEGHDQDRNDGNRAEQAINSAYLAAPVFGVAWHFMYSSQSIPLHLAHTSPFSSGFTALVC